MATRKAASVFPDPVGARRSVDSPRAMTGHPKLCAGVGSPNTHRNHCATGAKKGARGDVGAGSVMMRCTVRWMHVTLACDERRSCPSLGPERGICAGA